MTFLNRLTIRYKLIVLILGVCLCALAITGTILLFFIRATVRETIVREIETDARVTTYHCNVALAFNNTEDVQRTLGALKSKSFVMLGVVYDPDGEVFAEYTRPDYQGPIPILAESQDPPAQTQDFIRIWRDILLDDEKIGTLCIQASLNPLHAITRKAMVAIALVLAVALGVGAVLAAVSQGIISHPILALARTAEEISKTSDYSKRAQVQTQDEIGLLAQMFNKMLTQIHQRDNELVQANEQLEGEICERKKIEAELEKINQELQEFAHIVSHDLKAPLRGMDTLITWLADDYADQLDDGGKENLELLSIRSQRMRNLIDGILQYSRAGQASHKTKAVDLNQLLPEVIDMLQPPDHITVTVDENLPTVEFEETRLYQVFQNLLSNAIKYIDKPEGQITLRSRAEDAVWRFSISDNGPGIEAKYFERIFKMFQTLEAKDTYESTGVGLALIKKIVEMYGGTVGVESDLGQGTTFWFTVPMSLIRENHERLTTHPIS